MERRFVAIRVFGTMLKILAWIALFLGLLLSVVALVLGLTSSSALNLINLQQSGILLGIVAFLLILILSVVLFLQLYAAGELLYLLLAVEENTRRTAYLAQQQFLATQAVQPSGPASSDYVGAPTEVTYAQQ
jgi:hypothetical protein